MEENDFDIVEYSPTKNKLAKIAGFGELGGYATQMVPSPWTRIGGGIAAMFGGLGRDWLQYSNGNQGLGETIVGSLGDIGFPILGIIAPQFGQARAAAKAAQVSARAAEAAEKASKVKQATQAISRTAKQIAPAAGRYAAGVGTAGFMNYGLPALVEEGDPISGGLSRLGEDVTHITDPRSWKNLTTTFVMPLMFTRNPKTNQVISGTGTNKTIYTKPTTTQGPHKGIGNGRTIYTKPTTTQGPHKGIGNGRTIYTKPTATPIPSQAPQPLVTRTPTTTGDMLFMEPAKPRQLMLEFKKEGGKLEILKILRTI